MSDRDSWETPQWLFDWLDKKYRFNLDVAATEKNRKCLDHMEVDNSEGRDCGLKFPWLPWNFLKGHGNFSRVFCNPPYSNIMPWLVKAKSEVEEDNCEVAVFILPQDLSTKWGKFCVENASKIIILVGGRVQFIAPEGVKSSSNTKGTMIVEFNGDGNHLVTEYIDIKEITK